MPSPRRPCSTALGLALGLALGVGVAACNSAEPAARVTAAAPTEPAPAVPVELPSCRVGTMVGKGGTACITTK